MNMATDTNISIYDIDTPSHCKVVDTNTGKAIKCLSNTY